MSCSGWRRSRAAITVGQRRHANRPGPYAETIRGIKVWVTNQHEHNELRAASEAVLGRRMDVLHGEIESIATAPAPMRTTVLPIYTG